MTATQQQIRNDAEDIGLRLKPLPKLHPPLCTVCGGTGFRKFAADGKPPRECRGCDGLGRW